jgi:hypothetical protein
VAGFGWRLELWGQTGLSPTLPVLLVSEAIAPIVLNERVAWSLIFGVRAGEPFMRGVVNGAEAEVIPARQAVSIHNAVTGGDLPARAE